VGDFDAELLRCSVFLSKHGVICTVRRAAGNATPPSLLPKSKSLVRDKRAYSWIGVCRNPELSSMTANYFWVVGLLPMRQRCVAGYHRGSLSANGITDASWSARVSSILICCQLSTSSFRAWQEHDDGVSTKWRRELRHYLVPTPAARPM
jgi:hypothetical protein